MSGVICFWAPKDKHPRFCVAVRGMHATFLWVVSTGVTIAVPVKLVEVG